jgi:hypothetical protein
MRKLFGAAAPALFLLAAVASALAQAPAAAPASALVEKEQVLGSLGDGKNIRSIAMIPTTSASLPRRATSTSSPSMASRPGNMSSSSPAA